GHAASEAELRVMSRVVAFGAVAERFAAAAHDRGKGAGSQITQAKELLQELGSFGFQSIDIVRHKGFLSVPQIVCTYIDVQNNVTKKEIPQDGTSMSLTPRAARNCSPDTNMLGFLLQEIARPSATQAPATRTFSSVRLRKTRSPVGKSLWERASQGEAAASRLHAK